MKTKILKKIIVEEMQEIMKLAENNKARMYDSNSIRLSEVQRQEIHNTELRTLMWVIEQINKLDKE